MDERKHRLSGLAAFIHRHFLGLLIGSYAAAALWPAPGLELRWLSLGEVVFPGEHVRLSLSLALLAFLLFSAGLGVQVARLKGLLRGPRVLCAGLAANLLIPLAFLFVLTQVLGRWHNPDEVQNLLVGMALVAAMPVAGSSAAWSQRGNGDLAVSLGLVLGSTLLSPLTTPAALHAAGRMASGDYARSLHELAESGTGAFLVVAVVLPSFVGVLASWLAGEARLSRARPHLKLASSVALLVLCYTNAAVSLPQAVAVPDWDFLAVLLAASVGLCVLAFAAGWGLARLLKADPAQRTALMYGLGMNNNGTGLVLAGAALAAHPRVLLPIIVYNLVQHLVAGAVGAVLGEGAAHAPGRGFRACDRPRRPGYNGRCARGRLHLSGRRRLRIRGDGSMGIRILVVEDEAPIADFVVRGLREEGFTVEHVADGESAWHALRTTSWDVVLLDWWLPGPDGLTLLRRLREADRATPVLFLTARDGVSERVRGLDAGADDYLCKPFAFEELLARVRALARRREGGSSVLDRHGVRLDLATGRAERAGRPLDLTAKEQALLVFFLRHPGEVLSRTRIYEQVWDERYDGLSNTLEVHVMELRRKLEAHGPRLIHTLRGRGYLFGDPPGTGEGPAR